MGVPKMRPASLRLEVAVSDLADSELEQDAISRLSEHIHFRCHLSCLNFQCVEGHLQIRGRLPSYYLKQMLQTVLRDVPGVISLSNEVDVVSSTGLSSTD